MENHKLRVISVISKGARGLMKYNVTLTYEIGTLSLMACGGDRQTIF